MGRHQSYCFAALLLTFACGGAATEDQQSDTQLGTSHAALCAGAPETNGIYVTLRGCAFEQQTFNIMKYGDVIAPQALLDATGQELAKVSASCDQYWLGEDTNGLAVILDSDTGRVLSHGSVHPGLPLTQLPDQVPLPLTLGN